MAIATNMSTWKKIVLFLISFFILYRSLAMSDIEQIYNEERAREQGGSGEQPPGRAGDKDDLPPPGRGPPQL
jgi:hypothetical protein